jgi:methylated-DNA-[protein]-cysteine S-methyltransferase
MRRPQAYIRRMTQYALFETAIGWAGVAWSAAGLAAVHLPERDAEVARRGFLRRFPALEEAEPPTAVAAVIDQIRDLLAGGKPTLRDAVIDLSRTSDFNAKVYAIARDIPPGETLTYGEVAARLGDRLLARDVGQALGQNPWPIVVPCHRVTAAGGKLGGFSARGGAATKLRLLAIEGAKAAAQPSLFG